MGPLLVHEMSDTRSNEELIATIGHLLESGAWTHEAKALALLEQRVREQAARIAELERAVGYLGGPEALAQANINVAADLREAEGRDAGERGAWRQASGAAPAKEGSISPEEAIRRGRE
jgi:DUF1680 family protein